MLTPTQEIYLMPGAMMRIGRDEIEAALKRHWSGDWGALDQHDQTINNQAALEKGRILSVYRSSDDEPFWIITEHGHHVTTVLLPEEY